MAQKRGISKGLGSCLVGERGRHQSKGVVLISDVTRGRNKQTLEEFRQQPDVFIMNSVRREDYRIDLASANAHNIS